MRLGSLCSLILLALLVGLPSGTRTALAQGNLVLLFDKRCSDCTICSRFDKSRRAHGEAALVLLERQSEGFLVRAHWLATYGIGEGPKGCLEDFRTPEGLYHTDYVNHLHATDHAYGYLSIVTDYPNAEDVADLALGNKDPPGDKCMCRSKDQVTNLQARVCGKICQSPGGAIAIHGGYGRPTAGCIRVLDPGVSLKQTNFVHSRAIRELGELVTALPNQRMPVIMTRQAAPGCQSDVGTRVSKGCAAALAAILDAPKPPRRSFVNQVLAEAPGQPNRAAVALPVAKPPAATEGPPLHALKASAVWATSEATVCGAASNQRCKASDLISESAQSPWCEGVPGVGESQWLWFKLDGAHKVAKVVLRNGDLTQGPAAPLWFARGHVSKLEILVDGRPTLCSHPQSDPAELECDLDNPLGSSVVLKIRGAVAGEKEEHTCISAVSFLTAEPEHL
jgi:hypothetical protein